MARFLSKYKSSGAPSNAVMTPTGISVGASAILAIRSASTINVAPAIDAAIVNCLWSGPIAIRAAWGAINPINPISPDSETALLVSKEATIMMRALW